jgi:hypothetical protein
LLLKSKEEARRIHMLFNLNTLKLEGIPIAIKWIFGMGGSKGLTNEMGHATLTNIKFVGLRIIF